MFIRRRHCGFLIPLSVILFFLGCSQAAKEEKHFASLDDSTSYVGIATCRKCHEDKYQTFIHTGMGMSFDRATKQKSSAVFESHDVIYDRYRNLSYHPYWKGDSLKIDEFRLSGKDTIYKRSETIDWIVGSGQHTNSHLTDVNGYIYQIPATFYTQKKQWDLPPGFENGYNTRFSRAIGLECMSCHNAYPKFVTGSENKYEFIANGIDCERCHGPGSKHVKDKLAGNVVDVKSETDYSIVNPAKLPIELQLDVCQRCHIQGNAVLKDNKSFLDFRPAMKLSDVMDVYMPVFNGDNYEHIMASHAERMKMSKCYIASLDSANAFAKNHTVLKPYTNAMTCVTCHDPHVSVRSTGDEIFNGKCKSCHHAGADYAEINPVVAAIQCKEKKEVRALVNDNCVSCHMPGNGTIDIPHVTNTDHWIRVPVQKSDSKALKVFATLNCINNREPSMKSRGIAFLSYYEKFSSNPAFLDSASRYFNKENPDSIKKNLEQLVRLEFLRNDYRKVIDYAELSNALEVLRKVTLTNDNAWTCYRIGESYNSTGDLISSIKYFRQAVQLAPFIPDFRNKLAGAQIDNGEIEEAKKNYEFILKENPEYTSAYINYGYLSLVAFNDVKKSERLYDKALSLDPDNIQALLNKAGLMLITGKKTDSRHYINEVLKRDKSNQTAQTLLKQLNKY